MPTRWMSWVVVAATLVTACSTGGDGSATQPTAAPAVTSTTSTPTTTTVVTPSTTTVPPTRPPSEADVQAIIDAFVAEQPVPFSIVVRDLERGTVVAHDPDREVWSASLYKLFVARTLLEQIADGVLDRNAGAGDGQGRTWAECLRDMIVVSDDDCGVAGINHVGRGALDPALAAAGYPGTHLDSPQRTTAADVDRFLTATHDGTLLGPGRGEATGELFGYLAYQQVNDRLARGLPAGTGFAHKTGDRTGWAHDAGIVASPVGDVLVVALSGPYPPPCCHAEAPGPTEAAAFAAFADLAFRLWAVFDGSPDGS